MDRSNQPIQAIQMELLRWIDLYSMIFTPALSYSRWIYLSFYAHMETMQTSRTYGPVSGGTVYIKWEFFSFMSLVFCVKT